MAQAQASFLSPMKAEDIDPKTYRIKVLMAGPSGSGKSTSLCTLPGRKLVIDYDGRKAGLVGFEGVEILDCFDPDPRRPEAWAKAEKIREELWTLLRKEGSLPWDSIMECGLTQLGKYAMNWALLLPGSGNRGLGGAPAQQHYMPQMWNLSNHVQSMKQLPVHYGLECHLELIETEGDGVMFLPKISGKLRTEIGGWFDECFYCFRQKNKDGKTEYFWETSGTGKWDFLKSNLNHLGKYWTDPVPLDFNKTPTGFAKLWELRFGKEAQLSLFPTGGEGGK